VLLDGLDEVIDEAQQVRALEEVSRWAAASPGNWFVLTCRVAGWQSNWLPGFRVFEVQDFDRDDVHRFIGAWYREVLRTEKANALGVELRPEQLQAAETKAFAEARERSEELWAALQANEGLMRLAVLRGQGGGAR
jgi:predicted NACHT family NTPase